MRQTVASKVKGAAVPVRSGISRACACGTHTGGGPCDHCKAQKHSRAALIPPGGTPLAPRVRERMESQFDTRFDGVRVHRGAEADRSAHRVNAQAFTVGSHIVLGSRVQGPSSLAGEQLLAHELAHVVQQRSAPEPPTFAITQSASPLEHQARAIAANVVAGDPAGPIQRAPVQSIQRLEIPAGAGTTLGECSPLLLQKRCVYTAGGFNGDRSGVETPAEMARYNEACRAESGYAGPDVEISADDGPELESIQCERSASEQARTKARSARLGDALNRSLKYMASGIGEEFVRMAGDPLFWITFGLGVGIYLALWLVPEPLFTKLAAAATTLAILSTGLFSISTIVHLASAWGDLQADLDAVQTDGDLEGAAERFGKRIGAVEADLLVFLASLLIGGKLPTPKGLPPAGPALASAESALGAAESGAVIIEGPWGRVRAVPLTGDVTPMPRPGSALALKVEPEPVPLKIAPSPVQEPAPIIELPVPKPKATQAAAAAPGSKPVIPPVAPGVSTDSDPGNQKKRPPFILRLPLQKLPHFSTYKGWIGVLQSDPAYMRKNPAQRRRWLNALRIGGSHPIPEEVYERGHRLGLTGEDGETLIRVPNWSRTRSTEMQVDHVIELQLIPDPYRRDLDRVENYELLDDKSNEASGPLIQSKIAKERAIQEAFDPSVASRVLKFDDVVMEGGTPGERWTLDEIQKGKQLDAYADVIGATET